MFKSILIIGLIGITSSAIYGYEVSGKTLMAADPTLVVSDVNIKVYKRGTDDANVPPVDMGIETVSAADGSYSLNIDDESTSKYYIVGEKDGLGRKIFKWVTGANSAANILMGEEEDINFEAEYTDLSGTVTDSWGEPIAGVNVELRCKISTGGVARFTVAEAITDENGYYEFPHALMVLPEADTDINVAALYFTSDVYDDGSLAPLGGPFPDGMVGPEMVADITLAGGEQQTPIISNLKDSSMGIKCNLNNGILEINNSSKNGNLQLFKQNGVLLIDRTLKKGRSQVKISNTISSQILIMKIKTDQGMYIRNLSIR